MRICPVCPHVLPNRTARVASGSFQMIPDRRTTKARDTARQAPGTPELPEIETQPGRSGARSRDFCQDPAIQFRYLGIRRDISPYLARSPHTPQDPEIWPDISPYGPISRDTPRHLPISAEICLSAGRSGDRVPRWRDISRDLWIRREISPSQRIWADTPEVPGISAKIPGYGPRSAPMPRDLLIFRQDPRIRRKIWGYGPKSRDISRDPRIRRDISSSRPRSADLARYLQIFSGISRR